MTEDEQPIAYTALAPGVEVCAASGHRVGTVDRVVADVDQDIFRGLVVTGRRGWRFVAREHIGRMTTARVVLVIDGRAFEELPEPTPAQLEGDRETIYAATEVGRAGEGFVVIARCARGGLFETLWVPGASLRAIRLGRYRIMRCPVHDRVEVVHVVDPATLTPQERAAAASHPAGRIP
ncbi:hypothetical protein [Intrasporangium sp. DVR]|uniref:hypothetical protein n=1 Tax=Intrasporangium sp. DVR TaxID=3127867 RepID=UPI00313A74F5